MELPGLDHGKPVPIRDYFYQYGPLHGDGRCTGTEKSVFKDGKCRNSQGNEPPGAQVGYFGNKVLAVSYGGTLDLAGYKGAKYAPNRDPLDSGRSWMRLADGQSLEVGATSLVLERDPNLGCDDSYCWQGGRWSGDDEIVVTTTDYLPGHSEKLTIDPAYNGGTTVKFLEKIQWPHNGVRYGGPNDPKQWTTRLKPWTKNSLDPDLVKNGAETRAAVALLSRSIRIVSGGDVAGAPFGYHSVEDYQSRKPPDPHYSYGGHMVIRQGFTEVKFRASNSSRWAKAGGSVTIPSTSTWHGKHPPTPT